MLRAGAGSGGKTVESGDCVDGERHLSKPEEMKCRQAACRM